LTNVTAELGTDANASAKNELNPAGSAAESALTPETGQDFGHDMRGGVD
jgi:hypothetical protein